jgi:membrane associated rhomboid family serine protease
MSYRRYQGFNLGPIESLIIANVILYIAVSINHYLISLFGLQPATFLEGQRLWTIVTNLFIHAPFPNIWHILGNMFTLYFFGSYLISLVRERNFFIVYFVGGILGNFVYLLLASATGTLYSIAIGASGAIFAVGGALVTMRPNLRVYVFPIPAAIPLWAAVIGGFLIMVFISGIAWQAHLGGLVFGLVMGYVYRRREYRRSF